MGRRRPEPHRGRVELPVEDVPAWKRWQLLQLERARPDEERRRAHDERHVDSILIGALVVGVLVLAAIAFALFGGRG